MNLTQYEYTEDVMAEIENQSVQQLRDALKKVAAKEDNKEETVDWESRKKWWLAKVQQLFTDVETWCEQLGVQPQRYDVDLQEQFLGSYATQKLAIQLGRLTCLFVPVGNIIFGGLGRVDVWCGNSQMKLLLVEKGTRPGIRVTTTVGSEPAPAQPKRNMEPEVTEWIFGDPMKGQYTIFNEVEFLKFLNQKTGA